MRETVTPPELIVKLPPAVSAPLVITPVNPHVPPELALQTLKCVHVSVAATEVQLSAAFEAFEPLAAEAHVACLRVVSVAALEVPAEPGLPVCSLIQE